MIAARRLLLLVVWWLLVAVGLLSSVGPCPLFVGRCSSRVANCCALFVVCRLSVYVLSVCCLVVACLLCVCGLLCSLFVCR